MYSQGRQTMLQEPNEPRTLQFGSLFSGLGGLDLGLEQAGLSCKWQVERDQWSRVILDKHWPDVPKYHNVLSFPWSKSTDESDRPVGPKELAIVKALKVPLIVGGDPCQENSNARNNGSDAIEPSLGNEFIRVLAQLRPKMFLRENPSAVRKDAPWPWFRFRAAAERLGYTVLPFRLRACCVGGDHERERLFLLGEIPDTTETRLEGIDFGQETLESDWRQYAGIARSTRWSPSPRICGATDGISDRVERLMGLGNAVDVGVGKWIGQMILSSLRDRSANWNDRLTER